MQAVLPIQKSTVFKVVLFSEKAVSSGDASCVASAGDTMFAMGCGRLFEGTAQQMWASLSKISSFPPKTRVYCGHEYTQANARYLMTSPDAADN